MRKLLPFKIALALLSLLGALAPVYAQEHTEKVQFGSRAFAIRRLKQLEQTEAKEGAEALFHKGWLLANGELKLSGLSVEQNESEGVLLIEKSLASTTNSVVYADRTRWDGVNATNFARVLYRNLGLSHLRGTRSGVTDSKRGLSYLIRAVELRDDDAHTAVWDNEKHLTAEQLMRLAAACAMLRRTGAVNRANSEFRAYELAGKRGHPGGYYMAVVAAGEDAVVGIEGRLLLRILNPGPEDEKLKAHPDYAQYRILAGHKYDELTVPRQRKQGPREADINDVPELLEKAYGFKHSPPYSPNRSTDKSNADETARKRVRFQEEWENAKRRLDEHYGPLTDPSLNSPEDIARARSSQRASEAAIRDKLLRKWASE